MDSPAHPPSSMVAIPMVFDHNQSRAREAIAQARQAIAAAEDQLACLDLEAFFSKNPSITAVAFSRDHHSNDQGGTDSYCSPTFTFLDSPTGSPLPHDDFERSYDLSCELRDILNEWRDHVDGKSYSALVPGSAFSAIGRDIMGSQAFDFWMALRERVKIDHGAGAPNAPRLPAARL